MGNTPSDLQINDLFDNIKYHEESNRFIETHPYLEKTQLSLNETDGLIRKLVVDSFKDETESRRKYLSEKLCIYRLMTAETHENWYRPGCTFFEIDVSDVRYHKCASVKFKPFGEEDEYIIGCMFFDQKNPYQVTELDLYELLPEGTEGSTESKKALSKFCRYKDALALCKVVGEKSQCTEMLRQIKAHNKLMKIVDINDLINKRYALLAESIPEGTFEDDVKIFIKTKLGEIFPDESKRNIIYV